MLNRLAFSLHLGVARDALTLVRVARWRRAAPQVLAERALGVGELDSPERCALALTELFGEQRAYARMALTIVLADDLLRLWQVTPPQGASRMADIEAACALRFQTLYGEPPASWAVMADWDARRPFLAAALPRALLGPLEQVAREQQLTIVELAPQFVRAWNRWRGALKAGAWFALVHDNLLTLGMIDARQLHTVRSVPLPAQADLAWLSAHLTREALRCNLTAPAQLQACGQVPSSWLGGDATLRCSLLDPVRRLGAGASNGAMLANTGARA